METPTVKGREPGIRITAGRRELIVTAAVVLVSLLAFDLSTESLTLTTYYPAPYGAYKQLRATEYANFAYVNGAGGEYANQPPKAVGVGFDQPKALMHIRGELAVENIIGVDSSNTSLLDSSIAMPPSAPYQYFINMGDNNVSANFKGAVGFGATPGGGALPMTHPASGADGVWITKNYIHLPDRGTSCSLITPSKVGTTTSCPGSRYITMHPGIYQEGKIYLPRTKAVLTSGGATTMDPSLYDEKGEPYLVVKKLVLEVKIGSVDDFEIYCCLK